MHHLFFIDAASNTTEQNESFIPQEKTLSKANKQSQNSKNFLKKSARFLHQYLDQPNYVRIFISKN
jgi:hypothetical protein